MSDDCIVDASVAIKLFLDEPLSDRADTLFDYLANDPFVLFYAPDLLFVECANILWKYARRYGYPADNARQDLIDLTEIRLNVVPIQELVADALEIALVYGVTAYDATYVALSQRLALPLVTAGEPLIQRLSGTEFDLRWLGAWPQG